MSSGRAIASEHVVTALEAGAGSPLARQCSTRHLAECFSIVKIRLWRRHLQRRRALANELAVDETHWPDESR
jgi:hypothetical protein